MNELNLSSDSGLPAAKPVSRWKKATLAGILSLLIPGMGQLVNRQPRKALVLGLMMHALRLLQVYTHWMLAFGTMIGIVAAALALQLGVAAEAAYSAGRSKKEEGRSGHSAAENLVRGDWDFVTSGSYFPDDRSSDS